MSRRKRQNIFRLLSQQASLNKTGMQFTTSAKNSLLQHLMAYFDENY